MAMKAEVFCEVGCTLGEGPLWHTERQELLWFDIVEKTLLRTDASGAAPARVTFDEAVSAAGIVDRSRLLVAAESGLLLCDIDAGTKDMVVPLEAGRSETRSNDGRAGPKGIFWISTMGWQGEKAPGEGAIYGVKGTDCRVLQSGLTIPNSICFAPDGETAYFTDTPTNRIMKVSLDRDSGWPMTEPALFADTAAFPGSADGSVVDSDGYLWNARWGGGCVLRLSPDGCLDQLVEVGARNATCPCFGGPDLTTLYVTTARMGDEGQGAGHVFKVETDVKGQSEILLALERGDAL